MTTAIRIPGYVAGTWDIDPIHSDVSFVVRHLGLARYRRSFERFSGVIVTAEDPFASTFTAEIDTASFDTGLESFNRHLLSPDFFNVDAHPTATLTSTALRPNGDNYLLDAELTLLGTTRQITLDVEALGFGVGIDGAQKTAFSASTTLSRADFGLTYQSTLTNGNFVISDDVRVLVEIEAVLRKDA
ncbi:polyisoprenoid-binding protein YceI [Actinokineospora baliensis]|uniref:YceI family protein n=1 Tax=Actinokineospora baliensis TaxID=547056 RepID=UPI0027DD8162|nr:YceI family protein [Actinokineospora baliensis]MBM7769851.1 polyisoprenoid-binding protein YceI [Actinokineospora baliensis]